MWRINLVGYYKAEAQPIQLPTNNLTVRSKLALHPRLNAIVTRAGKIVEAWRAEERERLRGAKAEAEKRLKELAG